MSITSVKIEKKDLMGGSFTIAKFRIIVDPIITWTLNIGSVRKPNLPGETESVYLFLEFTIIGHSMPVRLGNRTYRGLKASIYFYDSL